jgi:hypothetical protein
VLAFPKIKERGEIYLTVRIPGVRIASSECTIHFDADCRLPDATHLVDWYIRQFAMGFQMAYTHVGNYDLPASLAIKFRMILYNISDGSNALSYELLSAEGVITPGAWFHSDRILIAWKKK